MKPFLNLVTNIGNGLRLALFIKCRLERFVINRDQFLLLLGLDLLLEIGADYLLNQPDPEFVSYALPVYTFELTCLAIALCLAAAIMRREAAALQIGVVIYSMTPVLILLQSGIKYLDASGFEDDGNLGLWAGRLFFAYLLILLVRAVYPVCGRLSATTMSVALVLLSSGPAEWWFADYRDFWYPGDAQGGKSGDPYARFKALDAESLLYRQPVLLEDTLNRLLPQNKNRADLFYVGFAGFATEDVFSLETDYIKRLFDDRFGTRGHSVNLVNHLDTIDDTPLATVTNLDLTLKRIGRMMDRDQDMLFLYLSSHGGSDHTLTVDFWPLPLNDLTPERLKAMLDEAGIKWRVIVVSACYSGGFVEALKGPHTLVATASADDRTSFGCGSESDFTYFGEAVFKEHLQNEFSLVPAFKAAAASIEKREKKEKLDASKPQLSVGTSIDAYLAALEKSLKTAQCQSRTSKAQAC